jgi:lipopolysaccharide/colanic/teichoic acid biosynthesis glycosyltransferase
VSSLKFVFDKAAAATGLLLLLPLLLLIAVYVYTRMPEGPVLFRQRRVGRHGRLFTIYKFRTMAGADGGSQHVPAAGRLLRRYKLDELPELWNVLKGDMSFVGPRPDVEGYADLLEGDDRAILDLRPGITGPATMKYRHEEELLAAMQDPQLYNDTVIWPDKVRINLYYMRHYSFWKDIQMIACTLLGKRMAYAGEMI